MKSVVGTALASVAALGLLVACGSDAKSAVPGATTLPTGVTFPEEVTIPAGAIPSGVTISEITVDQMIAQFEQAGMKVDRACFTALLKDESLRQLVAAGGTPNQEAIQKFFTCLGT
jgi:ABC-type glycerol-3-phosphate transport system substrate-binding protein